MNLRIIGLSFLSVWVCFGQTTTTPAFEVASIKPAQPMLMGQLRIGMNADAGMLRYTNVSLKDCIRVAYRVKEFQVEGPDWLGNTRFDIVAKLPDGASKEQIPEMLAAMLVERFKLAVHRDTKEHAIYALVVGKDGPKLKAAEIPVGDGAPAGKTIDGKPPQGAMMMRMVPGGMHLQAPSASLANLAEMLSRFCERPVVDMTGIPGQYDFDLTFAPETMRGMPPPPGPPAGEHPPGDAPAEAAGSIQDSVQRYGLKLQPRKAPMEVVFVDHIEKAPTDN